MGSEVDSDKNPAASQEEEEVGVLVNIRCSNGSKFSVKASLDSTVGAFKAVLASNCDVPADQQRLIYKGRILKDDQTLGSYGLLADHTIHMVRGLPPAAASPAPAAPGGGLPSTPSGITRGVGSNDGMPTGLGGSLLPGLGLGSFGGGLPELEQFQQQLTQNPNMMREIMNTPAIQNLINNPEVMRSLMMSNPQMREIIDRNPGLAHILNDPSILRQTLEAARNPEIMREMMRNTDRAMSNIEASPEGFNMLRRMYENVQEPFLNATTMGGNNGNDSGANPFAALLSNRSTAPGTGGINNSSTTGSETATATAAAPNSNPLPNPWNSASGATPPTNAARSNPAGEAGAAGLGGLVGMDPTLTSMPDPAFLNQLVQNPAVSQMMQSLLSNPQYLDQIMNLNPQLRRMADMNPQLREMMQNPELLRQLTNPETLQQMMAMQQSLLSHLNLSGTNREPGLAGADAGAMNGTGMELLMNMFGGLGAEGFGLSNNPNVPPEELYATQLSQLQEMGFLDPQENIRALRSTSGNVHAAVERLLGNLGQ